LVITGAGLVPAAEDEPDEDGDGEALGRGDGLRPKDGTGDGGGTVAGPGAGCAGPDPALPEVLAERGEVPALVADREMIEVSGPPSTPTAITVMQASRAAAVLMPISRMRRRRRPVGSVNTGRPSLAGDFRSGGGRSLSGWAGAPWLRILVTAAGPAGYPGHPAGSSWLSAAGQRSGAPGTGERCGG
jgi:hypothetical protein